MNVSFECFARRAVSILASGGVRERKKPAKNRARECGFSVLEAIVSVAILAAALLPIMEFQGQSARAVAALERVESHLAGEQRMLASMEPVMRDFAGERAAPAGYRMVEEREIAKRVVRGGAGIAGRFELRLVELTVEAATPGADASAAPENGGAHFTVAAIYATPIYPVPEN